LKRDHTASDGTGREQGSPRVQLPNENDGWSSLLDLNETGPFGLITMHVELIPNEWDLGTSSTPEKWVFTASITGRSAAANGFGNLNMILGARPHEAYHAKHPFNCIMMEPEAYGLVSRGLPEVNQSIQNVMDWLINSHMYNVRQTMNNQFLVDPSRLIMSDFNNPMAGGGIRAKMAAYGTDLRMAVTQLPVQDVTRGHLLDMQYMDSFAQKSLGIN